MTINIYLEGTQTTEPSSGDPTDPEGKTDRSETLATEPKVLSLVASDSTWEEPGRLDWLALERSESQVKVVEEVVKDLWSSMVYYNM
ncbi:Uncharacterized protein HZ326_29419 [Fusarium oxysporum f. sp. albedinis]|nr:Uncharacterized protein HZ326_29419 [Fusarium oxysporum f. sp. albedinis]